jgi:siroheme synthase-like protein
VTVVSPELTERLAVLAKDHRVCHLGREYRSGDLAGFHLAFVAADDQVVNAAVAREGRERGIGVNAADDPAHCDFILPSVLRRGELVVAVATGGASPALTRMIREELEAYFTDDYSGLAEIVATVRQELRQGSCPPDAERWHSALTVDLRRLISEGKQSEARGLLVQRLMSDYDALSGTSSV